MSPYSTLADHLNFVNIYACLLNLSGNGVCGHPSDGEKSICIVT